MERENVRSFLSSSTTDRVHNANSHNQVIDLTLSFEIPTVNWPTGIIELNESVTDSPPIRQRHLNDQTLNDSDIVVINESPAPPTPLTRPRKAGTKNKRSPKTDKNDNSKQRKKTEENFRDRSPLFFGDCPICFEPLGKNPLASTKCGHVFCIKCLQQAVRISKRCPNCRTALHGKTAYHPLYFSKN